MRENGLEHTDWSSDDSTYVCCVMHIFAVCTHHLLASVKTISGRAASIAEEGNSSITVNLEFGYKKKKGSIQLSQIGRE